MLDSASGDTVAGRQGHQIQQAKGKRTPQFQLATGRHALKTENGVGNPPYLGSSGRIRPALRQQGLQGWAVHQGQLDGIFLFQGLRQQGLSGLRTLVALLLGAGQGEFAFGEAARFGVNSTHALIQADTGTSGQHRQPQGGQRQLDRSGTQTLHGVSPW